MMEAITPYEQDTAVPAPREDSHVVDKAQAAERAHFHVTDTSSAAWVLRRMAELRQRQQDIESLYEERMAELRPDIERYERWRLTEQKKVEGSLAFFAGLLEVYFRGYVVEHPKKPSLSLPDGVLQLRRREDALEVDEAAIAALAQRSDDLAKRLIKQKPSLDKTALRALLKDGHLVALPDGSVVESATGEVLEGIRVTPQEKRFTVRLPDGSSASADLDSRTDETATGEDWENELSLFE